MSRPTRWIIAATATVATRETVQRQPPLPHKYLDQALEYIAGHEGVWLTASDEIAQPYRAQAGAATTAEQAVSR